MATKSDSISLSTLDQTPEIAAVRAALGRWSFVPIGAFFYQADDPDTDAAMTIAKNAHAVAIKLSALRHTAEDAAALRALATVLVGAGFGGSNLLQSYADVVFALGVTYGVRLAGEGR